MTIPDGIFFDMDSRRLSTQARLLLIDCFRRANRQYPTPVEDLATRRAIRIVYRDGCLGMTRPAFVKARNELLKAGFLGRVRNENGKVPVTTGNLERDQRRQFARDWFWIGEACF